MNHESQKQMSLFRFMIYVLCLVALDQITKALFAHRDFFVGFLHIHTVQNFGLSFGLNFGTGFNVLILIFAAILFLAYLRGQKINLAIGLLIAGVVSNLVDRIVLGYVRDFLDIGLGFTFNLADVYIFLGLLVMLIQKSPKLEEKI